MEPIIANKKRQEELKNNPRDSKEGLPESLK